MVFKVSETDFNFTCNQGASALGVDPRTLKKRIEAANLKPVGTYKGGKQYRLADLARAAFTQEKEKTGYEVEQLPPKMRAEHYMAEKRRLEVLKEERELVKYDEAATAFANLAKEFSIFFATALDDIEQTGLFDAEQLSLLETLFDEQRQAFAQREFSPGGDE